MKHAFCATASILCLAACNKGPTVELHNATGNQVAQAVRQSGVMTGDSMVEPGLWQSRVTVLKMTLPGIPPQYAERMKSEMSDQRNHSSRHCLTATDVKKPKEGFSAPINRAATIISPWAAARSTSRWCAGPRA